MASLFFGDNIQCRNLILDNDADQTGIKNGKFEMIFYQIIGLTFIVIPFKVNKS